METNWCDHQYLYILFGLIRRYFKYEAVPESLKNVILVMNATGILVPPPAENDDARQDRQRTLWSATYERIEQFLPGFLDDIVPHQSVDPTLAT